MGKGGGWIPHMYGILFSGFCCKGHSKGRRHIGVVLDNT